jgi:hypothetical protein
MSAEEKGEMKRERREKRIGDSESCALTKQFRRTFTQRASRLTYVVTNALQMKKPASDNVSLRGW